MTEVDLDGLLGDSTLRDDDGDKYEVPAEEYHDSIDDAAAAAARAEPEGRKASLPSPAKGTKKKINHHQRLMQVPTEKQERSVNPKRTPKKRIDGDEEGEGGAPLGAVCDNTYVPNLHPKRGPCQICVFKLNDEEKVKFELNKRHLAVNMTRGGCRGCKAFPSQEGEDPVRICRQCFFDTHKLKPYCEAPFSGSRAMPGMPVVQVDGKFGL